LRVLPILIRSSRPEQGGKFSNLIFLGGGLEDLEDGEEDVDFRFMSLLYHYLVFKPKRGLKENIMDENDELKQKEEVNNNIECQNIEEDEETKQDEIKIEECNNNEEESNGAEETKVCMPPPPEQGMYNLITFGKFENRYLKDMLRDRKYCAWLKEEEWFKTSYEHLYNAINSYNPKSFFFKEIIADDDFMTSYKYFNLLPLEEIRTKLESKEIKCYVFYLKMIENIKKRIEVRKVTGDLNPYDIKAPVKWLQAFETETKIPRDEFKEFLYAYELPNITTIVEDIRKEGGLDYNGGKSYIIGKKRSSDQEAFWGAKLKTKFGEKVSSQYKYLNCIFDYIHIPANTIYECKLALKDFNEEQFVKYEAIMNRFNIIYLIGYDCVINMDLETIYTNNLEKYVLYQCNIPCLKKVSKFDEIIFDYDIQEVEDLIEVL